jgi:hypothetical protein
LRGIRDLGLTRSADTPTPSWEWRAGKGLTPGEAGKVVANKSSRLYHKATCGDAARIAVRNRVTFDSAEEAAGAGYRPAKDCHSGK